MRSVKKILWSCAVLAVVCGCTKLETPPNKNQPSGDGTGVYKVVAHRGGYQECARPDCSISSLKYAIMLRCFASECDIVLTGDNDVLVTSLAKDKGMVKIVGLAIANGFAALAGSVYCQQKGFFEISTGTGTIVIGLANVIIGTQLFKRFGFVKGTTAVIAGSILYKACVSLALNLGGQYRLGDYIVSIPITASDLKLITSILFLVILLASTDRRKKVKSHA